MKIRLNCVDCVLENKDCLLLSCVNIVSCKVLKYWLLYLNIKHTEQNMIEQCQLHMLKNNKDFSCINTVALKLNLNPKDLFEEFFLTEYFQSVNKSIMSNPVQ